MITFATFWCFTKVAKQELTIPVALPAMATFQMVQQPLFELPGKIFFFLRTRVSVRRLERFLSEEDLDEVPSVATEHAHQDNASANGNLNGNKNRPKETEKLAFIDSTHIYPQQQVRDETVEPFTLSCSDITFPKGKLTVVYGDNASGKTSLLMACIGGKWKRCLA